MVLITIKKFENKIVNKLSRRIIFLRFSELENRIVCEVRVVPVGLHFTLFPDTVCVCFQIISANKDTHIVLIELQILRTEMKRNISKSARRIETPN